MLVIFCRSGSVALIIPKVTTISKNVTLQEAFAIVAPMKSQNKTEFDGAFCKIFPLLLDRFSSFFR